MRQVESMYRTIRRHQKDAETVIELQRVPCRMLGRKGSYRVAVLRFRSITVGKITKSLLIEVDDYSNITRLQDAERVFNWALTGQALRLVK